MSSASSPIPRWSVRFRCGLVILIVVTLCLGYGPSILHNDYAWDDWELFINSPYLRDPSLVLEGLVKPILPGTTYFRPLPLATFAIEFAAGSVNPVKSHAVNFLIHCVNTFLVGYIFSKLYIAQDKNRDWYRPILAAAIYALHPALVEPVAWAAGRFDLLVTMFYLANIAIYLKCTGGVRLALLFFIYLAACFSKEMAATLPLVLVLIEFQRGARAKSLVSQLIQAVKSTAPSIAVLFAAGLIYVCAKYHFMGKISHVDSEVISEFKRHGLDHVGFVAQTLVFYLKMMLWPFSDLSPHHPFAVKDMNFAKIFSGILSAFVVLAGVGYCFAKRMRSAVFFVISVVCLLPVLNIIPLTIGGNIGHERFLTLPLAFFAMSVAAISLEDVAKSIGAFRILYPVTFSLVGIWLALAFVNVKVTAPLWKNDLTLWKWAFESNSKFFVANLGYLGAAVRYQEFELADQILQHAKSVAKNGEEKSLSVAILEARLLGRNNDFDSAIKVLQDSRQFTLEEIKKKGGVDDVGVNLAIGPRLNSVYYTALAEAYIGAGDFQKAKESADVAVVYGATYPLAWLQRAFASYGLNDWIAGENYYAVARKFIADTGSAQIDEMRKLFLLKLCAKNSLATNTCAQL